MKLEDAVKLVGLKFLIPVVFQRWLVIVINFNKERAFCVGFFFFFPFGKEKRANRRREDDRSRQSACKIPRADQQGSFVAPQM